MCPSKPPPQSSAPIRSKLIKRIAESPLALLIGLVAAVVGIVDTAGGALRDALRPPDISVVGSADPSQLFAFPFAIKNNSSRFVMRNAQFFCYVKDITLKDGHFIRKINVTDDTRANIEPDQVVNYRCDMGAKGGDIANGDIVIMVKYKTLFIPRTFDGTEFTWYMKGSPPQWLKGEVLNGWW